MREKRRDKDSRANRCAGLSSSWDRADNALSTGSNTTSSTSMPVTRLRSASTSTRALMPTHCASNSFVGAWTTNKLINSDEPLTDGGKWTFLTQPIVLAVS